MRRGRSGRARRQKQMEDAGLPTVLARLSTEDTAVQVQVLRYKRKKDRYVILNYAAPAGATDLKGLCKPGSLVLAPNTTVWVVGLVSAAELNERKGVVEGFDEEKGRHAVRVEGRAKLVALRAENCLAAVQDSSEYYEFNTAGNGMAADLYAR